MLFMAYEDTGHAIKAYCVPDNYDGSCNLVVISSGQRLTVLSPSIMNQYQKGRHKTGLVDYQIDETVVEGLADLSDLELREEKTNLLVYRRLPTFPIVNDCIFRLETRFLPSWKLDAVFKDAFRFWYSRIEMHSVETVRQILAFYSFGSLYSSGRILINNYHYYLGDRQKSVICMPDPFTDLAEKILILHKLDKAQLASLIGDRDALIYEFASDGVKEIAVLDEVGLKKIFKQFGREELFVFSNPVCRQLLATSPDEPLKKNIMSGALQALAQFEIVGIDAREDEYFDALEELVGIKVGYPKSRNSEVGRIAQILRTFPMFEGALEHDLLLYEHIESAFKNLDRTLPNQGDG